MIKPQGVAVPTPRTNRFRLLVGVAALMLIAFAFSTHSPPLPAAMASGIRGVRITSPAPGKREAVVSGTIVVNVSTDAENRNGLVVLSVSSDARLKATARVSRLGSASMVLNTALLGNGSCEIDVRDLKGHSDTRRVTINNPVSGAGHFSGRDGLTEPPRSIPDFPIGAGNTIDHALDYDPFFPVIFSYDTNFEIHFSAKSPGNYPMEIRDANGQVVRNLFVKAEISDTGAATPGTQRSYIVTNWNGKANNGQDVPNGEYQVRVILSGRPNRYQSLGFVHKATKQPSGKSAKNVAANVGKGTMDSDAGLRFIGLSKELSGDALVQVAPATASPGHLLLLLDGEPIAASEPTGKTRRVPFALNTERFATGRHLLEARDFEGHSVRKSVVFRNEVSQILYEPQFDTASPDATVPRSHFMATLTKERPWKVAITDEKERTIRVFTGRGRTILFSWDGDDQKGNRVADGTYAISLRGSSPDEMGYIDLGSSNE